MNCLNLGCYTHCGTLTLPLVADQNGNHIIKFWFDGVKRSLLVVGEIGEMFQVANVFNEFAQTFIEIWRPDQTRFVHTDVVDYTRFYFNVVPDFSSVTPPGIVPDFPVILTQEFLVNNLNSVVLSAGPNPANAGFILSVFAGPDRMYHKGDGIIGTTEWEWNSVTEIVEFWNTGVLINYTGPLAVQWMI